MQDNRFGPAPHPAIGSEKEVDAVTKGIASASSELRGGGLHGTGAAGAGGDAPVGGQIGVAVADDLQAENAAPTPRNASPPLEPVVKTFPESWREDLAGSDKAFRKTLD